MTKSGLRIDVQTSPGSTFQVEREAESRDGDLRCHAYSLEDAVPHLAARNLNGILTIEL